MAPAPARSGEARDPCTPEYERCTVALAASSRTHTIDSVKKGSPVEVYGYLDYRAFLADLYTAKKARGFSYRSFSRRAGLSSPNYLKLVIDGQRNLSAKMAERFALPRRASTTRD